jgi:protein phosphatase
MQTDTATFIFDLGYATHTGLLREQNEDSFCVVELDCNAHCKLHKPLLLAVADGMGGEEAGEVASGIAVRELTQISTHAFDTDTTLSSEWVQQTVRTINDRIVEQAQLLGHFMGTTLVFALICDGIAHLGNVGDSRMYLWNAHRDDGALFRLTKDHSFVQMLVDEGVISDEERYIHPKRNYITRTLGDSNACESDVNEPLQLERGDWLMLCSDGMWEMARDESIRAVLSEAKNAQDACDALVALANLSGGEDNITVVVARLVASSHEMTSPSQ